MWNFLLDTAADSSSGTTPTGNPMDLVWQIALIVIVIAAFYFLMIRPQKKQQREAEAMRDGLAIGDEVTTIGGIIGQIVSIKGETVTIVTSKDKTKIRFLKGAIRNVDVKANGEVPAGKDAVKAPEVAPEELSSDNK